VGQTAFLGSQKKGAFEKNWGKESTESAGWNFPKGSTKKKKKNQGKKKKENVLVAGNKKGRRSSPQGGVGKKKKGVVAGADKWSEKKITYTQTGG